MPKLNKVLTEADLSAARAPAIMDLTPYLTIIDEISAKGGVGGEIVLAPNESQRTEKRRLSLAAKQKGLKLTWRKSPPGELRFVLSSPGQPAPGGRRRRGS
ncbi:MAG: hypothetical protein ACYC66_02955 [Chloroflexota bacterium]